MLPDDYENLAESVVASSFFANNILQCITTKNYWDIVMHYKPLMNLWYVGLLMQVYVIIPLIYLLLYKCLKKSRQAVLLCTIGLTLISLFLYVLPYFSTAWKFYYLPFRLFEITVGGLVVFIHTKIKDRIKCILTILATIILIFILCSKNEIISVNFMLILTTIMTVIFLAFNNNSYGKVLYSIEILFSAVGKRSYSFYIWHQAIIAFLFYSVFPGKNIYSFVVFFVLTSTLSLFSYKFIEVPLKNTDKRKINIVLINCIIVAIIISGISLKIYKNAGVVRDVPELNISKDNVHRNMHAEYCDRVYSWDKDFDENSKIKVLVIGNSFGRDFANILSEWDKEKKLDISYKFYSHGVMQKIFERIKLADFVFFALNDSDVPQEIISFVPASKLYIIGNKNYGESNGIIYAKRGSSKYFSQTVELPHKLVEQNKIQVKIYGNHYIDMMLPVMIDDKHVKVFTDDGKFISQDCRHLTQAGAQYYAKILELDKLFS